MTRARFSEELQQFLINWEIIPFLEALFDKTGGNPKIQTREYLHSGLLPIIDQGQQAIAGYTNDLSLQCRVTLPCILFGDHTRIIKFADKPFALGADGVKVLVPNGRLDARFVFYYLQQLHLPENAGYSRHFKFLKNTYVPVPPLQEQQRIAAILDKADSIRRKRQEAIRLANEFLRSVFLDMFGDPVTNPKQLSVKPIRELGKVITGNTPPREISLYYGDAIEWIKSDNINTPNHFLTEASEGLSEEGKKIGRVVPSNSILVTCIAGSPECIGNAALTNRKVAFNQQINAIVPNNGINPFFLYAQILLAKKLIQKSSTNSMKGMVSKSRFEEIELLAPDYDHQRQFGFCFEKIINLSNKLNLAEQNSEELFNSLVQRAFRGEL